MNKLPKVSIVVPVLNNERDIGECIKSLLAIDYPSYEIIVVDNGSTDKTAQIVSKYPVKLVVARGGGRFAAANLGISKAHGEIIAFTDSDCVVDKGWLKNLVRNYIDKDVGGVGGQILSFKPATWVEEFADLSGINRIKSRTRQVIEKKQNEFFSGCLVTANLSFRKSVLDELRGFDPELDSGGDYDLCWRVQRAGYKLIFDPEAIIYHKHRRTLLELMQQFFFYGKYAPLLLKRQPQRFSYVRIKIYGFPSYEFRCRLPIQMLITIDSCSLLIFSIVITMIVHWFIYPLLFILLITIIGVLPSTLRAIGVSRRLKWFLLFPFLHLVRNFAYIGGKIYGGIKHRVIAI